MDEYLGGGVYVRSDDSGGILLLTNDHLGHVNQIYLESEVFDKLIKFEGRYYLKGD